MASLVIDQIRKDAKVASNHMLASTEELRTENAYLKKMLAEKDAQVDALTRKITEGERIQEKLEYQLQSLLTQLETSPDGILIEDENVKIFSYN